jgi:hypothetical protein
MVYEQVPRSNDLASAKGTCSRAGASDLVWEALEASMLNSSRFASVGKYDVYAVERK